MNIYFTYILSLLFFQGGSPCVEPCDVNLKSLQNSQTGYQDRENRWEGMYESKVTVPGQLELISLTWGELQYEFFEANVLTVDFRGTWEETVKLRALARDVDTYYQMDALLKSSEQLKWPLLDVLFPEKLFANRIGVFGIIYGTKPLVYIPVQVVQVGGEPPQNDQVVALYRAPVEVYKIRMRSAPLINGKPGPFRDWQTVRDKKLKIGRTLKVIIPPGESLCVEISCRRTVDNVRPPVAVTYFRR